MVARKVILALSFLLLNTLWVSAQKSNSPQIKKITSTFWSPDIDENINREIAFKTRPLTIKIFNDKGDLIKRSGPMGTSSYIYHRNSNGDIIDQELYEKGKLMSHSKIEFSEDRSFSVLKSYKRKKNLQTIIERVHDKNGNITFGKVTDYDTKKIHFWYYTFDEKNQLIERQLEMGKQKNVEELVAYAYDESGNQVSIFYEILWGKNSSREILKEFDLHNNVIEESTRFSSGEINNSYYEYSYDQHNNWITRKHYDGVKLMAISERQIEYFE